MHNHISWTNTGVTPKPTCYDLKFKYNLGQVTCNIESCDVTVYHHMISHHAISYRVTPPMYYITPSSPSRGWLPGGIYSAADFIKNVNLHPPLIFPPLPPLQNTFCLQYSQSQSNTYHMSCVVHCEFIASARMTPVSRETIISCRTTVLCRFKL